jgi:hypothetical protein
MYRSVLWAGVSGELPLTTPTGRCQLYATANKSGRGYVGKKIVADATGSPYYLY